MIAGRFNDGHTAESRPVTIHLTAQGLDIRGEDGAAVAFWQRHDLRVEALAAGGLRIACRTQADARLTVEDGNPLAPLLPSHRPWARGAAMAAAGIAALIGLWFALPLAATAIAHAIPLESEIRWGGQVADALERHWGTCRQPDGAAALAELAGRLAAGLPPKERAHRVAVIKLPMENAIALPGGRVLLFKGLLAKAQGGDEVAGVLAHEFTHVAERHAAAAMIRALGVSVLVTLVTGDSSGAVASVAGMAVAGTYSREDEAAADRGAVALLAEAGIAADGLAAFFRRMAEAKDSMPQWLSTHPDPLARAAAITHAARPGTSPAMNAQQWKALKGICTG